MPDLQESSTMKARRETAENNVALMADQKYSAMTSIQKMLGSSKFAALALQESSTMKALRDITENNVALMAYQKSPAMKSIQEMLGSSKFAVLASQESSTMKALREITENNVALMAYQKSSAMKSIQEMTLSKFASLALQESSTMKAIREMAENNVALMTYQKYSAMESIQEMTLSKFAALALQESPVMKAMKQLNDLSSFKPFKNLNNSSFNHLITSILTEEQLAPEAFGYINEYLSETESEIDDEFSVCNDFNELSDKAKAVLIYIINYVILPFLISCYATSYMSNAETTRKEFESTTTAYEVRSLIRNPTGRFDRNLLKGYRVITGVNINVREAPNMKSNIITRLPIGTLVEIIDKSNKSWLLVEFEVNGEQEQGWIFRRYTEYFK